MKTSLDFTRIYTMKTSLAQRFAPDLRLVIKAHALGRGSRLRNR